MSIASAYFTKTAIVQRLVETEVSGEIVKSYTNIMTIKCAARPMSAVEQQGVSKTVGECDYRFYCVPKDIRATDNILFDNRVFTVQGAPINVMEMGDHIMINAKEVI